jgi:hypothetical protein
MEMRFIKALAASALLVTGFASATATSVSGEQRLAKILEGRTAGPPVRCIYMPSVRNTRVISRTAIIYEVGSTLYVNRPAQGANMLSSSDILVTDTHSSQLCDIDIVKLRDQGMLGQRGKKVK